MWGYLTEKADVYSFGIVVLKIVCGRSNIFSSDKPRENIFNLLDWDVTFWEIGWLCTSHSFQINVALVLKEKGTLMELVDPRLGSDFNKEEVIVMINVALLCTNVTPAVRPTMSSVVCMLEDRAIIQELVSDLSSTNVEMKLKEMRNQHQHNQEHYTSESQMQSMSIDSQWTAASTSATDLYPISLDSDFSGE